MDINDVMRNFSSKATSMKVSLLKSAIHQDTSSSKSFHSDGNFNNWRVPSSNFDNVWYTFGYWDGWTRCCPATRRFWSSSKSMTLYILLCSHTTMTTMYSMLFVNFGVRLQIHFLLSLERSPYQFGIYKGIFIMKSFPRQKNWHRYSKWMLLP